MQRILRVVFAAAICCALVSGEQLASPVPDARYKADLLLVVAHPDDETAVAAYLANVVFDERRKVAVVFATNGSAGGNFVGNEQAASLGLIREIEARRALGTFGIFNVWFLGLPDTPGQDPIISLENWRHGAAIERLTRIIRLTRPEVLLTWIPANLAGEHGDHQAAGIISLEASDAANDGLMLPEQIALPRDRLNIRNSGEGLKLWRVKKLYFFSEIESFRPKKSGPIFDPTATSGRQNVPYYRLAAEEASHHLTQAETGQVAKR